MNFQIKETTIITLNTQRERPSKSVYGVHDGYIFICSTNVMPDFTPSMCFQLKNSLKLAGILQPILQDKINLTN